MLKPEERFALSRILRNLADAAEATNDAVIMFGDDQVTLELRDLVGAIGELNRFKQINGLTDDRI